VTGARRVPLGGTARQIALSPAGHIFVLLDRGQGRGRLACFDPAGRGAGYMDLPSPADWPRRILRPQLRVAEHGDAWLGFGRTLLRVGPDGRVRGSLDLTPEPGEELGSFLLLPDGFVVGLYRPVPAASVDACVARLDAGGRLLWSTPLPAGDVAYAGVVEMGVQTGWAIRPKRAWKPRDWQPSFHEPLLLAGDRLLTSYFELRSGIGRSFCLDPDSGQVLWATEPRPEASLAVAGPGEFFVGSQGYGAFDLYLYGRDGTVRQHWDRHAEVVLTEQGEVRGVEMENVEPSRMHFSVFLPDGTVRQGPHLDGYYTTYPVVSKQGVTAFCREGELQTVDLSLHRSVIAGVGPPSAGSVMTRMLLADDGTLVFGLGDELCLVATDLGPMADSPWPCGGGNARGNPVFLGR
jgi:hypothetical protein